MEQLTAQSIVGGQLLAAARFHEGARAHSIYVARCVGPRESERADYVRLRDDAAAALRGGRIDVANMLFDRLARNYEIEEKWNDTFPNLVPDVGKNAILDTFFAGNAYNASITMGLKGAGAPASGDTMSSHGGWLEVGGANAPAYSGTRQVPTWSAAASGAKAIATALTFSFTSAGTVAGAFMVSAGANTQDDTTGVLVSAGDFTGGSKTVANGDQLNVSWSMSL